MLWPLTALPALAQLQNPDRDGHRRRNRTDDSRDKRYIHDTTIRTTTLRS